MEDDNAEKKPAVVQKKLSPSNLPLPSYKKRDAIDAKTLGKNELVLCDFFSDSEGDGSPNPELLVLPNVNTGVNIEALFASSPGTQNLTLALSI